MNDEKCNPQYDPRISPSPGVGGKPWPGHAAGTEACCSSQQYDRQPTGRSHITARVWKLRQEADRLEALLRALPMEMTYEAEQALSDLIASTENRG